MPLKMLWKRLTRGFRREPADWAIDDASSDGPYVHPTSIVAIAFSSDDSRIAVAGGGCLPGADSSIAVLDGTDLRPQLKLQGHVCGIYSLAFGTGSLLASASFDYAVHLWNLDARDVIFGTCQRN